MKTKHYKNIILIAFAAIANAFPTGAFAQILNVRIATGSDDLREGNTAYISLLLTNGTLLPERPLGGGFPGNSVRTVQVPYPEAVPSAAIRSIRIRHDGNPRSGHLFDDYDKWDLRTLDVSVANSSVDPGTSIYNSARDSQRFEMVNQFTNHSRQIQLFIRAIRSEPDFVITRAYWSPSGLNVTVRNAGPGRGRVTQIACFGFSGFAVSNPNRIIAAGSSSEFFVRAAPTTSRPKCIVTGVDMAGLPEVVTAINVFN